MPLMCRMGRRIEPCTARTIRLRMRMKLAVAAAALVLSSCYISDEPLIESGDQIPVTGKLSCQGPDGKKTNSAMVEKREGLIFGDYSYGDGKREASAKFKRISGNFYVAQEKDSQFGYVYFYAEFDGSKRVIFSVVPAMLNPLAVQNLAVRNGVSLQEKSTNDATVFLLKIIGPKEKALAFLMAHEKSSLMAVMACDSAP